MSMKVSVKLTRRRALSAALGALLLLQGAHAARLQGGQSNNAGKSKGKVRQPPSLASSSTTSTTEAEELRQRLAAMEAQLHR